MAAFAQRDPVVFDDNVPVQVALKFAGGKPISTRSGPRMMYSLADGRVMFLDPGQADLVTGLHVKPGEAFWVCKYKRSGRVEWNAWLDVASEKDRAIAEARADGSDLRLVSTLHDSIQRLKTVGEQKDGTFLVPTGPGSQPGPAPAQPAQPTPRATPTTPAINTGNDSAPPAVRQVWSQHLLSETNELTAVYAAALKHATEQYGGLVKAEDVKSFVITAYIQRCKGGSNVS